MTDYDEVRTCCKGADLCKKCWPFLSLAAQILDDSLRNHFGFKHLLWVYSGRRGIHCWVCDEEVRKLKPDARSAIADYLTVIDGGQYMSKKVTLDSKSNAHLHPLIKMALEKIDKVFDKVIVNDQNIFGNRKRREEIISWAYPQALQDKIKEHVRLIGESKSSMDFWKAIQSGSNAFDAKKGELYLKEVKLQLCYPRLDINVSKGVNHLLKAPFCVHPKTGRLCVPFDIKDVDKFDPTTVPIVKDLVKQLDEVKAGDARETTDMKKSIFIFDKFLQVLVQDRTKEKLEKNDEQMDF